MRTSNLADPFVRISYIVASVTALVATLVFKRGFSIPVLDASTVPFWTAFGAVSTTLTVIILAITAIYARSLIVATKDTARITLTNDVLNSAWLTKAMADLNDVINTVGRDQLVKGLSTDEATQIEKDHGPALYAALAAIVYVARLYEYGALDKRLVVATTYLSLGLPFYALHPLTLRSLNLGTFTQSDLNLARAYRDMLAQTYDPQVRGWMRDWKP